MFNRILIMAGLLALVTGCSVENLELIIDTEDNANMVTVSGTVTYTAITPSATGLSYTDATEKPIRGALVELTDSTGVVASGITSSLGYYSLKSPKNSNISIIVKAALGANQHTKVVDNTADDALYAISLNITTTDIDLSGNDFNATTKLVNGNYSKRYGAPFAILDSVYRGQQKLLAAQSDLTFVPLEIAWSENNKPTADNFNLTTGDIGTSFFDVENQKLYILGAENSDTDEYDAHVVMHEWGHYIEDQYSRSDSFGGPHGDEDILDPTVAFSEGFANAWAAMMLDDALYIDTSGTAQAEAGLSINLESDAVSDTLFSDLDDSYLLDGFYSENSIAEVLYDLADAKNDDNVQIDLKDLWSVLTGHHKNTKAHTTIFSYLNGIKTEYNHLSSSINTLAENENIQVSSDFDASEAKWMTTVTLDAEVTEDFNADELATSTNFGDTGNKLFNLMYFRVNITNEGCYLFKATAEDEETTMSLRSSGKIFSTLTCVTNLEGDCRINMSPGEYSFLVGSNEEDVTFSVQVSSATNCQ